MEYQPNVRALLELSGYKDRLTESHMAEVVKSAPDPETAVRHMLAIMPIQSTVLQSKWRKYISQLWSQAHPKISRSLHIPLTSREVAFAPVLIEVYTLVQELLENPVDIHENPNMHFMRSSEEVRIASELSLFGQDPLHVRRVCALLEELRLIRCYGGKVRVIESRYRSFAALPLPSQFYLLWHVDMYHLDWKEYFHEWGSHLVVFQQYLPMVWELLVNMQAGQLQSVDEITMRILRSFRPLWQQEATLGLYEQSALQGMVEMWLVEKVFVRYGFVSKESPRMLTWTHTAEALIELERTTLLPCSTDVLS